MGTEGWGRGTEGWGRSLLPAGGWWGVISRAHRPLVACMGSPPQHQAVKYGWLSILSPCVQQRPAVGLAPRLESEVPPTSSW